MRSHVAIQHSRKARIMSQYTIVVSIFPLFQYNPNILLRRTVEEGHACASQSIAKQVAGLIRGEPSPLTSRGYARLSDTRETVTV